MLADLATWAWPASIAWDVWFSYFVGAIILCIGLVVIKKDVWRRRGLDKIIALGPVFLAVPIAVFGSEHFTATKSVERLMPSWIPGHLVWVLLVGVCLIGAALSLVVNKYAGLAAALFGIMLLLFEVLISIPRIVAALAADLPGQSRFGI
jgi:hypothetical protein